MKTDVIQQILTEEKGLRREGGVFIVDDSLQVTIFAGATAEFLTLPKITRIDLSNKEYARLMTTRGERYFFPYELILGVKIEDGGSERTKSPGSAGFR
jgi:hypothetical protein